MWSYLSDNYIVYKIKYIKHFYILCLILVIILVIYLSTTSLYFSNIETTVNYLSSVRDNNCYNIINDENISIILDTNLLINSDIKYTYTQGFISFPYINILDYNRSYILCNSTNYNLGYLFKQRSLICDRDNIQVFQFPRTYILYLRYNNNYTTGIYNYATYYYRYIDYWKTLTQLWTAYYHEIITICNSTHWSVQFKNGYCTCPYTSYNLDNIPITNTITNYLLCDCLVNYTMETYTTVKNIPDEINSWLVLEITGNILRPNISYKLTFLLIISLDANDYNHVTQGFNATYNPPLQKYSSIYNCTKTTKLTNVQIVSSILSFLSLVGTGTMLIVVLYTKIFNINDKGSYIDEIVISHVSNTKNTI